MFVSKQLYRTDWLYFLKSIDWLYSLKIYEKNQDMKKCGYIGHADKNVNLGSRRWTKSPPCWRHTNCTHHPQHQFCQLFSFTTQPKMSNQWKFLVCWYLSWNFQDIFKVRVGTLPLPFHTYRSYDSQTTPYECHYISHRAWNSWMYSQEFSHAITWIFSVLSSQ